MEIENKTLIYARADKNGTLIVPKSIKIIGKKALAGDLNLKRVILPSGIRRINAEAFKGCKNLREINFPLSLKIIKEKAFCDCVNLCYALLPQNLTYLGDKAFSNTGVIELEIKKSLKYIPDFAFSGCQKLLKVKLDEGVLGIGNYAFSGCKKLRDFYAPASLEVLKFSCFEGCDSLESLTVYDDVFFSKNTLNTSKISALTVISDDEVMTFSDNLGQISGFNYKERLAKYSGQKIPRNFSELKEFKNKILAEAEIDDYKGE